MNKSFDSVMSRRNEILETSSGLKYNDFECDGIAFNYEKMMSEATYQLDEMSRIQLENGVGNTPLIELKNITKLARKYAPEGKGARIFIKDEACNASGSFKARRASISVYHAKKLGYKGVIAATSGNYGAAVASQAMKQGLKAIIVQECYDSKGEGQPEIIEKARKCEAYGAEVVQLSVGPELFYQALSLLEDTGYFNASLYTPFGIAGVETLGYELAKQCMEKTGKFPTAVVCTNAGGGNLTGTARGLEKAMANNTKVIGASVNLKGLHMASDIDFNKKSFTTGHTGFGVPFATFPDRSDVPRSAARPLRYMDRYVTVNQGEVFYMTEMLAQLEGLERGPAGNTSLAAAFAIAREMNDDDILVVQETEYTGAGKHISSQLSFARKNGIKITFGNPQSEIPGKTIVLPEHPKFIQVNDIDLLKLKKSLIKNHIKDVMDRKLTKSEKQFLADEVRLKENDIEDIIRELGGNNE